LVFLVVLASLRQVCSRDISLVMSPLLSVFAFILTSDEKKFFFDRLAGEWPWSGYFFSCGHGAFWTLTFFLRRALVWKISSTGDRPLLARAFRVSRKFQCARSTAHLRREADQRSLHQVQESQTVPLFLERLVFAHALLVRW